MTRRLVMGNFFGVLHNPGCTEPPLSMCVEPQEAIFVLQNYLSFEEMRRHYRSDGRCELFERCS